MDPPTRWTPPQTKYTKVYMLLTMAGEGTECAMPWWVLSTEVKICRLLPTRYRTCRRGIAETTIPTHAKVLPNDSDKREEPIYTRSVDSPKYNPSQSPDPRTSLLPRRSMPSRVTWFPNRRYKALEETVLRTPSKPLDLHAGCRFRSRI